MIIRTLYIICLLTCATLVCNAGVKIALIGDSPAAGKIADRVLVALSSDENIQILERTEIDKVLKEHKLTASSLAAVKLVKLFPHVDIFAVIQDKRLVVFNAKNGFRLIDANVSKVQELAYLIRRAVKKLSTANLLYLSIVSVRNIGIPLSDKPKIKELIRIFEQELIKQSNIQMLERAHLALVDKERELTNKLYKLKSSVRLLTLECESDGETDIINIKLIIRNLANNITGTVKISGKLTKITQTATSLREKTLLVLSNRQNVSAGARQEAQRFFKEYQRLVKSQGSGQLGELEKFRNAKDKLFSALALAPNDKSLRYAELIYYGKMLRGIPMVEKTAAMYKQLQRAKKFRADFGICSPSVFYIDTICGGIPTNYSNSWTDDFQKQYSQFCREFRPLFIADIKSLYYPYDLADGINSLKELGNLANVVSRSNWSYYYGNPREWRKQRLDDYTLLYKEAAKYLASHPQEAIKVNQTIMGCFLTDIFFPNQSSLALIDLSELTDYLEQTKDLCRFVSSSKLNSIKPEIFLLDTMRACIREKTEENFTRAIDQYYKRLASVNTDWLRPRQNPNTRSFKESPSYYRLRNFCGIIIKQFDLPDRRLKIYQKKHAMNSDFEDLDYWMRSFPRSRNNSGFAPPHTIISALKKFCLLSLKNNNFGNRRGIIINTVFQNDRECKPVEPAKMKFFFEVNSNFNVATVPYYKLSDMTKEKVPVKLCGAAQCRGEILLFFDNKQLFIRKSDGAFVKVPPPDKTLLIPENTISGEYKRPIALTNSHIAFIDIKNSLHIYDRAKEKWFIRKGFSTEPVRSLLIHFGKIYALAGDGEWAVKNRRNYMFSCNLDGSSRKIIFSSERSEKLNDLDKLRGGLSSLTAIDENKLAFLLTYTNKHTYVWQYDIKRNRFERLFKAPYSGTDKDVMWQGLDNALYLVSCSWVERLYRISPKKRKTEWIFCQRGRKRKFDSPDDKPVFFNGRSQLQPPWRINGNYLWCGGGTSAFLDLNNIDVNPPLLLLPRTRYIYELGDNKMIFLGDSRYFIVSYSGKKRNCPDK